MPLWNTWQQFVRFIDPRRDENPNDACMVLRGASAQNAYIGYAPVTNAEYAEFNAEFVYDKGKDNYPAVGISIKDAEAYCDWLTAKDPKHTYRLPSEEEWPNTPIAYRAKKSGFSQQDTCPRMLQ